jgi:hypothetical protein
VEQLPKAADFRPSMETNVSPKSPISLASTRYHNLVRSCWGTEDRRRRTVEQGFSLCSLGVGKRPFVKAGPNRTPPRCSEAPFCEGRPGHSAPGVKPRVNLRMLFVLPAGAPERVGKRSLRSVLGRSPAPLSLGSPSVRPSAPAFPLWWQEPRLLPRERRVVVGCGGGGWLRPEPPT